MNFRLIPKTSAIVAKMESHNLESMSKVYEYADLMESRLEAYKIVWRLAFFCSAMMGLGLFRVYMIVPWMLVFPLGIFACGVIARQLQKNQKSDLDEAVQLYLDRLDSRRAFAKAVKKISKTEEQSARQKAS